MTANLMTKFQLSKNRGQKFTFVKFIYAFSYDP